MLATSKLCKRSTVMSVWSLGSGPQGRQGLVMVVEGSRLNVFGLMTYMDWLVLGCVRFI